MANLDLTIACQAYDRVQALQNGSVRVEGCNVRFLAMSPEEVFHRAYEDAAFDVCELSMSSHIVTVARQINRYAAIPVFPSRMFRHSGIYVRGDREIERPQDLRGKVVGVPEFQMTAALWMRGMLEDEYDVPTNAIRWRTGGLEQPGRKEKFGLTFDGDLEVVPVGDRRALAPMLQSGEIDALLSARAPSCYGSRDGTIRRLFEDYRSAEEAYFRKTKLFPIMHVIGVRRDLVERYPWLPASLLKAFERAKQVCMEAMEDVTAVSVGLPWLADDRARTISVMGADYWPYGVGANRTALEAMLRYSHAQYLVPRMVAIEELFAPGTYENFRV